MTRTISRAAIVLLALAAASVLLAACTDDNGGSTTVGTVVFGEGELPDSFPDDFPIPEGTRIGSFLVDGINIRSEVEMRVPLDVPDVAAFFEENLPDAGLDVDSSEQTATRWTMTFSDGDLTGEISMTQPDVGLAVVVVEVNRA